MVLAAVVVVALGTSFVTIPSTTITLPPPSSPPASGGGMEPVDGPQWSPSTETPLNPTDQNLAVSLTGSDADSAAWRLQSSCIAGQRHDRAAGATPCAIFKDAVIFENRLHIHIGANGALMATAATFWRGQQQREWLSRRLTDNANASLFPSVLPPTIVFESVAQEAHDFVSALGSEQASTYYTLQQQQLFDQIKAFVDGRRWQLGVSATDVFNGGLTEGTEPQRPKSPKKRKRITFTPRLHPILGLPTLFPFDGFHRNHQRPIPILYHGWSLRGYGGERSVDVQMDKAKGVDGQLARWRRTLGGSDGTQTNPDGAQLLSVLHMGGVGYFQTHVSGGHFVNMWHSFGDYFTMLFDTLSAFANVSSKVQMTWLTRAPSSVVANQGCRTAMDCAPHLYTSTNGSLPRFPILRHFIDFFGGRVVFVDDLGGVIPKNSEADPHEAAAGAIPQLRHVEGIADRRVQSAVKPGAKVSPAVHFHDVFLGLANRCTPIPDVTEKVDACQEVLDRMRTHVLSMYGMSPSRAAPGLAALPEGKPQPTDDHLNVHIMNRQGNAYRSMKPYKEVMEALRSRILQEWAVELKKPVATGIRSSSTVSHVWFDAAPLHGGMTFAEQVSKIHNTSVLIAGRGAGTALALFLPLGAGYLSVSAFDRWHPTRNVLPRNYVLDHHTVKLVHHLDPSKPPQRFISSKGASYVDANRAGYLVDPERIGDAVAVLLHSMHERFANTSSL